MLGGGVLKSEDQPKRSCVFYLSDMGSALTINHLAAAAISDLWLNMRSAGFPNIPWNKQA